MPALIKRQLKNIVNTLEAVWQSTIPAPHSNLTYVPPDHNIQLVTSGYYQLKIEEQEYSIKPGSIIYYHKGERVYWLKNDVPVQFYSIVLTGDFEPLPIQQRVMLADKNLIEHFDRLYMLYMQNNSNLDRIQMFSSLLFIVESLYANFSAAVNENDAIWFELERELILSQSFRPTVRELIKISGYSESTIKRSCVKFTGLTPMKRLRNLRMEKAKMLIQYSAFNITEIAEILRFPRVHEFSREFKEWSGKTPTDFRN